jgi:hypothetical protein
MSHGDQVSTFPPDFHSIGATKTAPFAARAHDSKLFYSIQFHPEVTHTPLGKQVVGRFVVNICGCRTNWTMVRVSITYLFVYRVYIIDGDFRKNSSGRRSIVFGRYVDQKVGSLVLLVVASTALSLQNSCMKQLEIGDVFYNSQNYNA